MPSPDEVLGELEADRAVRENEVRLIRNLAAAEVNASRSVALRRSLVLVTYAHLEGFSRFALYSYVSALNALKLPCSDAAMPLVAASLHQAFAALRNAQSKHPIFAKKMPDDAALHMSWREQTFVQDIGPLMTSSVAIPDGVVNAESNLSPLVLKRNLYILGLNSELTPEQSTSLSELLGRRNAIAHGERVSPSATEVGSYVDTAFLLMKFVQSEVFESLDRKGYLRPAAA